VHIIIVNEIIYECCCNQFAQLCVCVCVCGHVTDVFLDQWRMQRGWGGWGERGDTMFQNLWLKVDPGRTRWVRSVNVPSSSAFQDCRSSNF